MGLAVDLVAQSHMIDDYEQLRTRVIRRLGSEIDLLADGLHALCNGAPEITAEFLERSLSALMREIEYLRGDANRYC
jgi:hypothetical protein